MIRTMARLKAGRPALLAPALALLASAASALEPVRSDGMPLPQSKPDLALLYPAEPVEISLPVPRPDPQTILPRATRTVAEMYLQQTGAETGKDTLDIASALAYLEAGKKSLSYDKLPVPPPRKKRRDEDFDRKDRSSRRGDRGERKSFRDDHLQSYRLEVGAYHGAEKGDIVGAIANEVGLDPRSMGKIRMFKDHTFIDLPKDMPTEIFEALKNVWVQGHLSLIHI